MKFVNKLKNKIAMNFISLCGWFFIFPIIKNNYIEKSTASGVIYFFYIYLIIICILISILIYLMEIIFNYKIKNKFILNNNFYNLFFIVGIIFFIFEIYPLFKF